MMALLRYLFLYNYLANKTSNAYHLSYMLQFRSIRTVILVLNIPTKLQAKLHDTIQYPRYRTNVQESL